MIVELALSSDDRCVVVGMEYLVIVEWMIFLNVTGSTPSLGLRRFPLLRVGVPLTSLDLGRGADLFSLLSVPYRGRFRA